MLKSNVKLYVDINLRYSFFRFAAFRYTNSTIEKTYAREYPINNGALEVKRLRGLMYFTIYSLPSQPYTHATITPPFFAAFTKFSAASFGSCKCGKTPIHTTMSTRFSNGIS